MVRLKSLLYLLFINILIVSPTLAQMEVNGTLDFSVRQGGANSSYVDNGVQYEYRHLHMALHEFNLTFFAPVDESFSVEARVKTDTWKTDELNDPSLDIAVLNWTPLETPFSASIGMFTSPFGLFPQEQYQFQRSFIAPPLAYSWYLPLSDRQGFSPDINTFSNNGLDVGRMSTMSYQTSVTGFQFDWVLVEDKYLLQTAITNGAPSATEEWSNQADAAIISRLNYNVTSYWTHGFSVAYGSFMSRDGSYLPDVTNPTIYRQMLMGSDFQIFAGPFTFQGEFIWSRWNVPRFGTTQFHTDSNGITHVKPALWTGYFDMRIDFPETNGFYIAARVDGIHSILMSDPLFTNKIRWFKDTTRGSVAMGKQFSESVLAKAVYSNQVTPLEDPGVSRYVLQGIVSVIF